MNFTEISNEQYVAGSILIDEKAIPLIMDHVSAEDFQCDKCQAIFVAAMSLAEEGSDVNPVEIRKRAKRNGTDIPNQFMADLMAVTPTAANCDQYAKRVAEDAANRRIKAIAMRFSQEYVEEPENLIAEMQAEADKLRQNRKSPAFLSLFKPLDEFSEEEASWLIPGWVPEAQITLMAADGGVGKTTLWCHVIAALSAGKQCILDPIGYTRNPQVIAFCTTEDSVKKKLLKKLRVAGANLKNIITMDFTEDRSGALRNFKFGSTELEQFIRHFKPALCVFDPVQGFLPPLVNMSARNQMRDCMAPLIALGEETGTTFMVICHTNKRKGAFGRDRIADSADLWDIARSVIMAGYTESHGVRYLSNEKNNYSQLQDTLLFSIDSYGQIVDEGTTWKRDKDYTLESVAAKSTPKRDDCKEFIIRSLEESPGGCMKSNDLVEAAQGYGYSFETIKRARKELKNENRIENYTTGSAKANNRVWYTRIKPEEFDRLSDDTPIPFDVL